MSDLFEDPIPVAETINPHDANAKIATVKCQSNVENPMVLSVLLIHFVS